MGKYSIKELEKLSGIKAHTIRIWEKRHKIIEPSRTASNIRFYSDEDLKKIINASLLNNNGIKISRIAQMTSEEMNRRVLEISESKNDLSAQIDQLVISMINMDEEAFEKILASLILRHGFEKTITEIVYPFLEKIGILWQTQNITPAHEHFISNLIRQKIIVAIDGLPIPPRGSRKIMLFLPEGELHELGLLFFHYICRQSGLRTYYIGQNTPHEDLIKVFQTHRPEMMLTSITSTGNIPLDQYFEQLSKDFHTATILASGYQVARYKGSKVKNIQTFTRALDLKQFI
jgi:DNA-binding transcriptional MerR regulator